MWLFRADSEAGSRDADRDAARLQTPCPFSAANGARDPSPLRIRRLIRRCPQSGSSNLPWLGSGLAFALGNFDCGNFLPLVFIREEDALDIAFRFAAMRPFYVSLGLRCIQAAIVNGGTRCPQRDCLKRAVPLAPDIRAFADGLGIAVAHFHRLKVGLALPREFRLPTKKPASQTSWWPDALRSDRARLPSI